MGAPCDEIRTTIAQRQQARMRCAQTIATLLDDQQLAGMASHFVQRALALLRDDECDLNGTPGLRNAIVVERHAWELLERTLTTPDAARQAAHSVETIKRAIDVQATLIELAIPETRAPLQELYDEYQQRYGKPPCD